MRALLYGVLVLCSAFSDASPILTTLTNSSSANEELQHFALCDAAAAKLKPGQQFAGFTVLKVAVKKTRKTFAVTYRLSPEANLDVVRDQLLAATGANLYAEPKPITRGSVAFDTNEDGATMIMCLRNK